MDGATGQRKVNRATKTSGLKSKTLPKRAKDFSKDELLLTLKKKKECNAKAQKIVEGLLEVQINENWFIESLQHINQSHYQDAVEERAIAKLCGYPLCSNILKNIPAQQYRISLRQNKVYDITERKNFCSNHCFRSSKYIRDQMLTSPLWIRDVEVIPQFKLLPPNQICGGTGDEVDVGPERVAWEEVIRMKREEENSHPANEAVIKAMSNLEIAVQLPRGTSSSAPKVESHFKLERKMAKQLEQRSLPASTSSVQECEVTLCDISTGNSLKSGSVSEISTAAHCSECTVTDVHEKCAKETNSIVLFPPDGNVKDVNSSDSGGERVRNEDSVFLKEEPKVPVSDRERIRPESSKEKTSQTVISSTNDSSEERERTRHESSKEKTSHTVISSMIDTSEERERIRPESSKEKTSQTVISSMNDTSEGKNLTSLNSCENVSVKNLTCGTERSEDNLSTYGSNAAQCKTSKSEVPIIKLHGIVNNENLVKQSEKSMKSPRQGSLSKARWKHQTTETSPIIPIVSRVEKCVNDWFTMDTMCYLFGESRFKEMLEEKGERIKEHYQALDSLTWDPDKQVRFMNICKRLNLLDIEDSNYDDQVMKENRNAQRKPLPDFQALKGQAEKMELKVRAFYRGSMEVDERKVTFSEDTKEGASEDSGAEAAPPVLPLVHLHAQRALRRRIVLGGLNRVLPDFLRTFGLQPNELNSTVRGLIATFALSAKNITFKPQEWSLLGLIVIKLLAIRDHRVQISLSTEQSSKYLTLFLMSYNLEPAYLDRLLIWLTDVDLLLTKQRIQDASD